jgi:hypothetical protein
MNTYLTTGLVGTPGLLARGGLVGGGLPVGRADLHFLYNLIETVPLWIAFVDQLQEAMAFVCSRPVMKLALGDSS